MRKIHAPLCLTISACAALAPASAALALDGGTLRVTPRNGWRAFEVISVGNNPAGDGFAYAMPGTYDGVGAWLSDPANLRLSVNHETSDASVSEVNLNLTNFRAAISNTIAGGTTGGVSFVSSARQAYGRFSNDGGGSFTSTVDNTTTAFQRFCSGQFHPANTFGPSRGFVDPIYMTGEEISTGRMFALDMANRDFYRLGSATVGAAPGGAGDATTGGMRADAWENAALLDTGETNHVAILLSPDGGSQAMQLYIGHKGKGFNGAASSSFLARNGLAYGNFYYLNDTLPVSGTSTDGTFDTTIAGAVSATKLEDVDTNPNDPTQAVIGIQEDGLFTFDFNLQFNGPGGAFNPGSSNFHLTKVLNHVNDTDGQFGDADNVDWTAATTLNNVTYGDGLIFVNEDSGTGGGETWMTTSAGATPTLIADTIAFANATETSGVLDISRQVGYRPGSVLLTSNQGADASLTVLINPNAELEPRHWDLNGTASGAGGTSPTGAWNGVALNFNTDSTGGNAGIFVADTTAADTVVFSAGADATGSYTVTLTGTRAAARIVVEQGNVTLTGGTLATAAVDVASGATATITSGFAGPSNAITKTGSGTLAVGKLPSNNSMSITAGTVRVLDSSPTLPDHPSGDNAFVSRPTALSISPGATLDLGNNDLIIDYTTTSPVADIEALVASGFNGGEWNGDGIISTTALADPNFVLAVAENALLLQPFGDGVGDDPLFAGQVVDDTTVLVKFTHRVDLDLDGLITGNDAAVFNAFFNEGQLATWQFGDLDYDGVYSGNDAAIFNGFYNESLASVPEPASLALAACGLALLAGWSPRRARPSPR